MKLLYAEFLYTWGMGGRGFLMKGRGFADPSSAFVAAHDMWEHFPTDRGSLENEMRALGAGLYLRREFNDHWRNIGGDIGHTLCGYAKSGQKLKRAPLIGAKIPRHLFKLTKKFARLQTPRHFHDLLPEAFRWALVGYALAKRKFKECPQAALYYYRTYILLRKLRSELSTDDVIRVIVCPKTGAMDYEIIHEDRRKIFFAKNEQEAYAKMAEIAPIPKAFVDKVTEVVMTSGWALLDKDSKQIPLPKFFIEETA